MNLNEIRDEAEKTIKKYEDGAYKKEQIQEQLDSMLYLASAGGEYYEVLVMALFIITIERRK